MAALSWTPTEVCRNSKVDYARFEAVTSTSLLGFCSEGWVELFLPKSQEHYLNFHLLYLARMVAISWMPVRGGFLAIVGAQSMDISMFGTMR